MNIPQGNGFAPTGGSTTLVIETTEGDNKGMVQIEPRHSLHNVRRLIQE
jgi:hypothetical protein